MNTLAKDSAVSGIVPKSACRLIRRLPRRLIGRRGRQRHDPPFDRRLSRPIVPPISRRCHRRLVPLRPYWFVANKNVASAPFNASAIRAQSTARANNPAKIQPSTVRANVPLYAAASNHAKEQWLMCKVQIMR